MWGRRKKSDDDGGADQDRPTSQRSTSNEGTEPNERTRLLTPRSNRVDAYLDPDDPAVSANNLWIVRFLRWVTVVFTAITFIWWVLLLVSIFVTPPGLQTRGSGFTDFSYTCLTLGNLVVSLILFVEPSKAIRICTGVLATILLADVIIVAAVERVRLEEGGPGIASAIWAFLIAVWFVMTDRVVEWGKQEEEERLTGRPERRRTLTQWLKVLFGTTIVIIFVLIAALLTATLLLRTIDAGLEPDGQLYLVDGDQYQVHLDCVGNVTETAGRKDPTILIEAGEETAERDFNKWAYAAWSNGTMSRYCYWDRPGYGWSDNAPSPFSAGMAANALSEALARAGETGPWISVSAGYGSVVARIFTARHRREVLGMMLVDALHEDLLGRIGGASLGFRLWARGIVSPLGIQRLAGAVFKGRTSEDRVIGKSEVQNGKFLKAKLQENLVAESMTKSDLVSSNNQQDENIPFVVVSSGIEVSRDRDWERKQEDLTKLNGQLLSWDVVSGAPHQVWQSYKGRELMEKRLKQLIKATKKK